MNGHFNKRGRNQRRRQGGGFNPNRALDSNGPDVRIRGTAQQIYDKYLALARDATSGGDRVKAENYLQHAEHYFRVLRAIQGPQVQSLEQQADGDHEGDQPSIGEPRGERDFREQRQPSEPPLDGEEPQPPGSDADAAAGEDANGGGGDQGRDTRGQEFQGRGDFEGRRRRRRRRHRDGGGESGSDEEAAPEPVGAE